MTDHPSHLFVITGRRVLDFLSKYIFPSTRPGDHNGNIYYYAVAIILSCCSVSVFAVTDPSKTIISRKDQLEITDLYTNRVLQKVRGDLRLNGILDLEPAVTIQIEFDEKRLTSDASAWISNQQDRIKQTESKQTQDLKQSVKDLIATAVAERLPKMEPGKERNLPESSGLPRLGRLNVDITDSTVSEVLRQANANEQKSTSDPGAPITLAINLPTPSGSTIQPFVFSAADYVSKVFAKIILPATTPKTIASKITATVEELLDLKSIAKGQSTKDWITVSIAEPLPPSPVVDEKTPTPQAFFKNIWRTENAFIGILATGLIVSVFILLSMLMAAITISKGLKTAFATLGKDIASLKPAEQKDETDVSDTTDQAESNEDSEEVNKYDSTATSHALTHEMATIRDQVRALVADQAFLCAEYLRDMLYSDSGLSDFKDFLSFIGYGPLKPALDVLPQTAIERLQTYVEENRDNPPDLLNGTEIAQRVYSECISKATLRTESAKALDPVRAELIKTEDVVIAKFMTEADSAEIALLLKTLTVERGNRLMKGLSASKIKAAAADLDNPQSTQDQTIAGVITKLQGITASLTEKSQAQRRLILRLAKTVAVSDEDMVYELVPAEDWDLKRQIMRQRIFLKDAIYLPTKTLSTAFNSLPLAIRAAIMIVGNDELKSVINNTIQAGSKKAEILQTEIEQIKKNAKKLEDIESNKHKFLESMITSIRKLVTGDIGLVDQIILAQAKALNIDPPADLKAKAVATAA
jgi:hypothetical protein